MLLRVENNYVCLEAKRRMGLVIIFSDSWWKVLKLLPAKTTWLWCVKRTYIISQLSQSLIVITLGSIKQTQIPVKLSFDSIRTFRGLQHSPVCLHQVFFRLLKPSQSWERIKYRVWECQFSARGFPVSFDYNSYKTILRERHLIFIPHLRTNLSKIGPILTSLHFVLFYIRPLYSKVHVHM